jgi:hypothetical protein
MITKFPIPVLCEDQDKSSYKNSFFIGLLKLDESVVLEKEQLVINFDLSTNLFDSGYFKPNQVKFMIKVFTEIRTIVFISDSPNFQRHIDENELINNEKIEVKAFIISKEKVNIRNNGHLHEIYDTKTTYFIEEDFVVAETNSYYFLYQRTGESFILISESEELRDKGFVVKSSDQNHIIISLEPELHAAIIKLNTRDNPFSKFIVSSLLLQTITIILTELSNANLKQELDLYKEKKWFNLLSRACEKSTGFSLDEVIDGITTDDEIDTNQLILRSQSLLNSMFAKSLMKIATEGKTVYEI